MQGKPKFPTLPKQPIVRFGSGKEEEARIKRALNRRMGLIAEHFGIDIDAPDGWEQLACRLAVDELRYPMLQVVDKLPKPKGQPLKWAPFIQFALIQKIEFFVAKTGCSIRKAASRLANSDDKPFSEFTSSRLRSQYQHAKELFKRYPRLHIIYKHGLVGPNNATTFHDARLP